jgi:threonine aldolase
MSPMSAAASMTPATIMNTAGMIDLRSDTVTRPTPGMMEAMNAAPVGDDVWGDDPSVIALQEAVAERVGKESALFFPSGTQSNLAALMAHCGRGDEYIVGQDAHTYKYEGGGAAVLGSIQPQPIENGPDGSLPLAKVQAAIKPVDPHFARTRLLALENTIGGKVLPDTYIAQAAALARAARLNVHLDGARVWNAAVANKQSLQEACGPFDSVSLCFSKGLGAPVGSALAGSRDLVEAAKRWRKVLGGGMRQSGYLAAACHYALDHHVDRLAEDHENAAMLARGLTELFGDSVHYSGTNMVFVGSRDSFVPGELATHLQGRGIAVAAGPTLRLVTHLDVSRYQIGQVIEAARAFVAESGRHFN